MKKIKVSDIAKVKSSNIESVAFGNKSIYVNFKNGTSYGYEGASLNDYEEFKKAESVGKHFHSHIRNAGYEVVKLEDTILEEESKPFSDNEVKFLEEISRLKKENEDLYQALKIKQERIDFLDKESEEETKQPEYELHADGVKEK